MKITESQLRNIVKEAMGVGSLQKGDRIDTPEKFALLQPEDVIQIGSRKASVTEVVPDLYNLYYVRLDDMEQRERVLDYRPELLDVTVTFFASEPSQPEPY
jgi:hypothetical protein